MPWQLVFPLRSTCSNRGGNGRLITHLGNTVASGADRVPSGLVPGARARADTEKGPIRDLGPTHGSSLYLRQVLETRERSCLHLRQGFERAERGVSWRVPGICCIGARIDERQRFCECWGGKWAEGPIDGLQM